MSKFIFEVVLTRPSTSVQWFEDHCIAVGQAEKSTKLSEFFNQHYAILNVNNSFSAVITELEKRIRVELNEDEYDTYNTNVDNLAVSTEQATPGFDTFLSEYLAYMKSNGIYYRMGAKEIADNGMQYQLSLETSDDTEQTEYFNAGVIVSSP